MAGAFDALIPPAARAELARTGHLLFEQSEVGRAPDTHGRRWDWRELDGRPEERAGRNVRAVVVEARGDRSVVPQLGNHSFGIGMACPVAQVLLRHPVLAF